MSTTQSAMITARKELFLLAARALAGPPAGADPGDRLASLTAALVTDEIWVRAFLGWARRQAPLRRLALAATAEFLRARLTAGIGSAGETRRLAEEVLIRADDPGDLLDHLLVRYGRSIPEPIKHAAGEAAERLYDEHALAVHDTPDAAMRFAEVIARTRPRPVGKIQNDVFRYAFQRLKADSPIPESLVVLRSRAELLAVPAPRRVRMLDRPDSAELFAQAVMGWRQVEAWLGTEMTGKAWAAVLPSMSYRQRLACLRGFESAGLAADVADRVRAGLADPGAVARGGALPLEILAAYRTVPGSRWSRALEQALGHALAQVPVLEGRTLVLVDRCAAMAVQVAGLSRAEAAAAFAAALALRSPSVEVAEFGPVTGRVEMGGSVLESVERFQEPGGAHSVTWAVRDQVGEHDRVIVLTHPAAAAEAAGAMTVPGHQHVISDVNDGWFAAIPAIERARAAAWPFRATSDVRAGRC